MSVVVAYVRVSSRAQSDATQRRAIRQLADAHGVTISAWYSEARSGARERPELARLRERARRGELKRLYVFRYDRLTRGGIRDLLAIVEELRGGGCELVSVTDGFALDGPAADVVLAVLAFAAQMERQAMSERISAARDRVEAAGGRWGRPRRLDDATVARAKAMRADGLSFRAIAVALKAPRETLQRALRTR